MKNIINNPNDKLIAVDLDGTLTKYPKQLVPLVKVLKSAGCDIFVLTACAGEFPPEQRPAEARRRVNSIGLSEIPVVWIDTAKKPEYCINNGVSILIDDVDFGMNKVCQLIPSTN